MGRHKGEETQTWSIRLPINIVKLMRERGGRRGDINFSQEIADFLRERFMDAHPLHVTALARQRGREALLDARRDIDAQLKAHDEETVARLGMSAEEYIEASERTMREKAVARERERLLSSWNEDQAVYERKCGSKHGDPEQWVRSDPRRFRPYGLDAKEAIRLHNCRGKPAILSEVTIGELGAYAQVVER